jgi:hypothetical protein
MPDRFRVQESGPEIAQRCSGAAATRAFELLAPDGERIWNEGLPDGIPVVRGRHLHVLDGPIRQRSWNADQFLPILPGAAELTRVLSADEARPWFALTESGRGTYPAA